VPHYLVTRFIRAVLLDIDGTLYSQHALRSLMALELCMLPLANRSLTSAYKTCRAIRCFRDVREQLRNIPAPGVSLTRLQYAETAKQIGEEPATIESMVSEWLYQRPLKYLRFCRRRGVGTFFSFLEHKGLQAGVFSDYAVIDKLRALGLFDRISVALCATDPAINAFKPHPCGFLRACTIWGLRPEEVLYVGDRPETDAVGAAMAGMPCAILSRRKALRVQSDPLATYIAFASFPELEQTLTESCSEIRR
jgi:FMN phosphatase YigB (HAD superfamily)